MSVRWKSMIPVLLLCTMVLGIVEYYWLPDLRAVNLNQYRETQRRALNLLAMTLLDPLSRDDLAQVYAVLEEAQTLHDDWIELRVLDRNGALLYPLASSSKQDAGNYPVITWTQALGGDAFVVFELVADPSVIVEAERRLLRELRLWVVIALILALAAGAFLESRWLLRPLRRLTEATDRLAAQDFSMPLPSPRRDEVGKLIGAFQRMRERIRDHLDELQATRDKALNATQIRSEFLAKMSHRLRTPLATILGASKQIQDYAREHRHDAYFAYVEKIRTSGKHLVEIVDDIMDLSKIETGRLELHYEKIDLLALVQEVVASAKPLVKERKNEIAIQVVNQVHKVMADPVKVRQLLMNLIVNAAKFTHNGVIIVVIRTAEVNGREYFAIDVQDTGQGIEKEMIDKIFEPFSTIEGEVNRSAKGIGLGLAICKQICELMDGEISVVSDPGKGSTFTFMLPMRPDDVSARSKAPAEEPESVTAN